jgi:hypothetical protein
MAGGHNAGEESTNKQVIYDTVATATLQMVMMNTRQLAVSKEAEATNVGRANPPQPTTGP